MRKRTLTPSQVAARDARRAKFKALWKQVAAMPAGERELMASKCGMVTCDGHPLSACNTYLVLLQCPGATVLGGFRQWRKHGRSVRKGEHGAMIWVPCGTGTMADVERGINAPEGGERVERSGFIVGTIFDISLTEEITTGQKFTPEMEQAEAPAPTFTPEVAEEIPATEPSPEPMPAAVAQPQDGFLF